MLVSSEAPDISQSKRQGMASLRKPTAEDGYALNRLVAACPPLDTNSVYCNLLQCTHFRDTCLAAELDGQLVGFVSAYIPPAQADTLFVWQIAVADQARGQGLAKHLLKALLEQVPVRVRFIETTITPDNQASWSLFHSLARDLNCQLESRPLFDRERHFDGRHPSEELLSLGPISTVIRGTLAESHVEANNTHSALNDE